MTGRRFSPLAAVALGALYAHAADAATAWVGDGSDRRRYSQPRDEPLQIVLGERLVAVGALGFRARPDRERHQAEDARGLVVVGAELGVPVRA